MKALTGPKRWDIPGNWLRIETVDAHTGGEPLRVITGGFPALEGETLIAQRRFAREHCDYLRTALMAEPRGHANIYGCIITPPVTPGADFGLLFMHNEGYSTMCGHGIIAVATVVLETGILPISEPETEIHIDTPAGSLTAFARIERGRVRSVYFRNVPSFVCALDQVIDIPRIGMLHYDIAFGGAFYAYVQADQLGLTCAVEEHASLVDVGMTIKHAIVNSRPVVHPIEKDLSFLYGTIFIAPPRDAGADSRNVCVFADGQIDRSPTGTGISGRMALEYARGALKIHRPFIVESIIGTRFTGRVVDVTTFGGIDAVIPEVEGEAHVTGRHEFLIDPDDPLKNGFLMPYQHAPVH